MYLFFALILGLLINYFSGGLEFYSTICVFAGMFLIMPFLLKTNIKEIIEIKKYKNQIKDNLIRNYIINLLLFIIIPLLIFGFDKIIIGFILLGLLSGGGLVLSWINKSKGNTKLGFKLFLINFIIFNITFLFGSLYFSENYKIPETKTPQIEQEVNKNVYKIGIGKENNKEKQEDNTCIISDVTDNKFSCFETGGKVSPLTSFIILIIFPFIVSRIIIIIPGVRQILTKNIDYISNIATFLLIAYIFSLKDLNGIFNEDILLLGKIGGVTLIIYLLLYFYNYYLFNKSKKEKEDITLFWIGTTRFITLGFIFSFIYSLYFGIELVLIFIFAYIYQIIFSIYFSKKIINKKD